MRWRWSRGRDRAGWAPSIRSVIPVSKECASLKLYVGNLPFNATETDLRELFGTFGTVTSASIVNDRETGRSRGFGFVEFSAREDAQKAIDELHDSDYGGRPLVVNEARPREDRGPRGGGGGGGYRGGGGGDRGDRRGGGGGRW